MMTGTTARTAVGRRTQPMALTRTALLGMLLIVGKAADSQHVYTDSFPTNDEWDFSILDSDSAFGSPYGGFSRATRSRLAALPLKLPALPDSVPTLDDENYYEVRDGRGRRFVCRVYHEDELEKSSLSDSMFNTAIERSPALTDGEIAAEGEKSMDNPEGSEAANEHGDLQKAKQYKNSGNVEGGSDKSSVENTILEELLSKLDGVCSQIHKGWWSYEWCHGSRVSQFHIHVKNSGKISSTTIEVEDVTVIGEFAERRVEVFDDPANTVDGMRKMGEVYDTFENGEICAETGKPRRVEVQLHCCSKKLMANSRGGVLYKGKHVPSNIASISMLKERETCNYHASVCTPVLCEGAADVFGDDNFGLDLEKTTTSPNRKKTPPKKENESIRETLDRTLSNVCLVTGTGGWWVYEFCHGRHIRQFHESTVMDSVTGLSSKMADTQYVLGLYSASDLEAYPNEEEADHVVNGTDGMGGNPAMENHGSSSTSGAYFVQEYKSGDVCDHSDVTDAAIKAGHIGTGGIERSTTVRFSCGPALDFSQINEDSTCHYVIDVVIPDLCHHPLFKVPEPKTQVVKCLPVEGPIP